MLLIGIRKYIESYLEVLRFLEILEYLEDLVTQSNQVVPKHQTILGFYVNKKKKNLYLN